MKNIQITKGGMVGGAVGDAQRTDKKIYLNIGKPFMANVKVDLAGPNSSFTAVELEDGKKVPFYHAGKKGPNTNILNMNFFGVTKKDLGKTMTFVCQVEVVVLPDGRFFLGIKLVKKPVENWKDYPILSVDTQLQTLSQKVFRTWQGLDKKLGVSPRIVLREQKNWVGWVAADLSAAKSSFVAFIF